MNNNPENKMDIENITTYPQLLLYIEELKLMKEIQEKEMKDAIGDIVSLTNLVSFFKKPAQQDQPIELVKSGINMMLDFISYIILGKHRDINGYISAVIAKKISSVLIDNNLINIIDGIKSLFSKKNTTDKKQE